MATVTCRTEGCENNGLALDIPHPNQMDEDTGEFTGPPVNPWNVVCGPCGQPITDIVEVAPT